MRRLPAPALADDFAGDLQNAVRMLRRAPAFTAFVVLILAIGVGATTSVFIMRAVLWHPLPYADTDGVVRVGPAQSWPDLKSVGDEASRN
jgi:hypothetical protein